MCQAATKSISQKPPPEISSFHYKPHHTSAVAAFKSGLAQWHTPPTSYSQVRHLTHLCDTPTGDYLQINNPDPDVTNM